MQDKPLTSALLDQSDPDLFTKTTIYIVFTPKTTLRWTKLFCRKFRHCFALVYHHQSKVWWLLDPLANQLCLTPFSKVSHPVMITFLKNEDYTTVKAIPKPLIPKPAPLAIYSCVSVLSRFLGIRKRFLFTPDHLYRELTNT